MYQVIGEVIMKILMIEKMIPNPLGWSQAGRFRRLQCLASLRRLYTRNHRLT